LGWNLSREWVDLPGGPGGDFECRQGRILRAALIGLFKRSDAQARHKSGGGDFGAADNHRISTIKAIDETPSGYTD
jgi:hypothetical protein